MFACGSVGRDIQSIGVCRRAESGNRCRCLVHAVRRTSPGHGLRLARPRLPGRAFGQNAFPGVEVPAGGPGRTWPPVVRAAPRVGCAATCARRGTSRPSPVRQWRPSQHQPGGTQPRARARDLLLRSPRPRPLLQVLHEDDLSAHGEGIRAAVRDPIHRLVQRRPRLGLRQRHPPRPPRLRHARQARSATKAPARSAIEPASGSSNGIIRCSSASGWAPTSNTIPDPPPMSET